MKILGIESSCDETAAAVVDSGHVLSNVVASQEEVHARFGGVVPELASRRHLEAIIPTLRLALEKAHTPLNAIEGVAATSAPGLLGSLLVGLSAAKAIALAQNIPFIGVNHLEGHLNAARIESRDIAYPYVGLIVSGGHTSLYDVQGFGNYRLLGATRDDAAGEVFDKIGKLLGLGFPGGPHIDRLSRTGNPLAFRFSHPRFGNEATFDFSFSGIKTAVMLAYRHLPQKNNPQTLADLAASFQHTVVSILVNRITEAVDACHAKTAVISGGVAANSLLRQRAQDALQKKGVKCCIPAQSLCTDNAAMIAFVGEKYLLQGKPSELTLNAVANQEIGLS